VPGQQPAPAFVRSGFDWLEDGAGQACQVASLQGRDGPDGHSFFPALRVPSCIEMIMQRLGTRRDHAPTLAGLQLLF
jgi:hypothetical protein